MNCEQMLKRWQRQLDERLDPEFDCETLRHLEGCSLCRERLRSWKQIASLLDEGVPLTNSVERPERAKQPDAIPTVMVASAPSGFPTTRRGAVLAVTLAASALLAAVLIHDHELPNVSVDRRQPMASSGRDPLAASGGLNVDQTPSIDRPVDQNVGENPVVTRAGNDEHRIGIGPAATGQPHGVRSVASDVASSGSPILSATDPVAWWRSVRQRDWVGRTMPAVKSLQEGVAPLGRSLIRAMTILTGGRSEQTS